jgi:hypothetical protein
LLFFSEPLQVGVGFRQAVPKRVRDKYART